MFTDNTTEQIDAAMQQAWSAFEIYRNYSLADRANFMRTIATELENCSDELFSITAEETNLPEARLRNEKARTIFQLRSYADACERGNWLDAKIDTADNERTPPKPDLRKTLTALGPVVVFGASNFPFAYSTVGGDTASAFAAGCPVIIKAHPAHEKTSAFIAALIFTAAEKCNMPKGIFTHIYGKNFNVGKQLVMHPLTKAVGFTGSFIGGKQLVDWANERKNPIPVFAEMGSTNPIFLFPEKINEQATTIAKTIAGSITLGVGQFCTKPGILIGIESNELTNFIVTLSTEIKNSNTALMLHKGIAANYKKNVTNALMQPNVETLCANSNPTNSLNNELIATPTLSEVTAKTFLQNSILHQEVFGPYAIIVKCVDAVEMLLVAKHLEGQLTCTVFATTNDIKANGTLIDNLINSCGRIVLNGVPTGVEVCESMQHGGPYPASSDSRFGSVGADAIKRFARPIAYQNWENDLLPNELKNENPLSIWRTINNELTKNKIAK